MELMGGLTDDKKERGHTEDKLDDATWNLIL